MVLFPDAGNPTSITTVRSVLCFFVIHSSNSWGEKWYLLMEVAGVESNVVAPVLVSITADADDCDDDVLIFVARGFIGFISISIF